MASTDVAIQQALQSAVAHHQAGRLVEAEGLYRYILSQRPRQPEALHLLGVIAHQRGQHGAAVDLIRQAIAARGNYAEAWSNLGNALQALGQLDEAIAAFRRAIVLQPGFADAHNNLGVALQEKGQAREAVEALRQAIALLPGHPDASSNLGVALRDLGRLEESIAACRRAVALRPNHAGAFNNLGISLRDAGFFEEAIAAFRQAIALKDGYHEAHCNLGVALRDCGLLEESIREYQRAIAICPDSAEAYSNLGVVLRDIKKFDESILACRRAIALKPRYAEAHSNLGNVLKDAGLLDEAAAECRAAIALAPGLGDAWSNLGNTLKDKGEYEAAFAAYREALKLKPTNEKVHSNLILGMLYHAGSDGAAIAAETRRWSEIQAQPLKGLIRGHGNDRSPERRLRIGYVSPDFREHPVGRCMLPLLAHHDKSRVEVFAYAEVPVPDAFTVVLRSQVDAWRNTVGVSDERLAEMVREDRIDILVDLGLHTAGNRLLVFARKPAPVQVTFAGYPGSTGLETIDYRMTDPYLDPPHSPSLPQPEPKERIYSEESWRLPDSFWCFDPLSEEPAVAGLPAELNGYVTFGCLNNFCKVNDSVLELWARVLLAVQGSRLMLLAKEGSHRTRTLAVLSRHGVEARRVAFMSPKPRSEYLALYQRLDIGLDTLPYNGHTTSLDSFWMGVPVITLVGQTVVGRAGLSQLTNLGLEALAARDAEGFVRLAADLAGDLPRLAELRRSLRERMRASPLMDGPRFARGMEAAYREMWRRWCAGAKGGGT